MDNDSIEKRIHDGFIRFGKMITKASILIEGTIVSVDETTFTCVVAIETTNSDGSTTSTNCDNVPLKVLIGSQASLIEIPKVDSVCTLMFRDNNIQRRQLFQVHECDKILIKIGNTTLQVDTNGFVFNGGTHGMVKADELKTESEKDKDILDGLLQVLQTPVNEPGNGAPSAFQAALLAAIGTKQSGVWTGLENSKVKQ